MAHPRRDEFDRRFVEYCDGIRAALAEAERRADVVRYIEGGELRNVNASEFDPDVRVALGRGLLPVGPHSQEEAAALLEVAFFMGGVLGRMAGHLFESGRPEQAEHLKSVGMSLVPLATFASTAAESGSRLVVDF